MSKSIPRQNKQFKDRYIRNSTIILRWVRQIRICSNSQFSNFQTGCLLDTVLFRMYRSLNCLFCLGMLFDIKFVISNLCIYYHMTVCVTQLLDLTNFAETWRHTSLPDLVIHTQRIRGVSRNALYKSTFTYWSTELSNSSRRKLVAWPKYSWPERRRQTCQSDKLRISNIQQLRHT